MTRLALLGLALAAIVIVACSSASPDSAVTARPLMFDVQTGDFFFSDSSGERVIYQRSENTLIVEPDVDVEELALAYCEAEASTPDPARFASVGLVLADGVIPFVETVEEVCDR